MQEMKATRLLHLIKHNEKCLCCINKDMRSDFTTFIFVMNKELYWMSRLCLSEIAKQYYLGCNSRKVNDALG